jgi:hypothetical protein
MQECYAIPPQSASTRYLGLARISRAAPWRQLPRTSIVFPVQRLAVSGYTTTSRVPRLGFPGGHAHREPASWISRYLVRSPNHPVLRSPPERFLRAVTVEPLAGNPTLGVLARGVLAL